MTVHLVAVGRCQTPNSGVAGGTGQCNGVGSQGGEFGAAPPSGAVTPTRRRSRVPQVWEESFVVSSWMCRATCFSLSS